MLAQDATDMVHVVFKGYFQLFVDIGRQHTLQHVHPLAHGVLVIRALQTALRTHLAVKRGLVVG